MKNLKDFSLTGRRVLVRCDFNVPLDKKRNIADDFRIRQTLPTIKYLTEEKAKIILMSHLDPENEGIVNRRFTLDKVAQRLSECLGFSIAKADDCVGPEVESAANSLEVGEVLLLENLRFHKEETENNSEFAKKLSYLCDIYVNDAFGACHRNHASIVGVPQFVFERCAGLLLEKEISSLEKITKDPEKPMLVIIGGRKVETRLRFIDNISRIADFVIIGGLLAKEIADKNIQLKYPEKIIMPLGRLDAQDISPESIKIFSEKIMESKTVLWNGPFGKFENPKYSNGTMAIAKAIIGSEIFSVVGGGETIEFLNKQGIIDKFSHVSTGGAAMLDYLSGEKLPGLDALR